MIQGSPNKNNKKIQFHFVDKYDLSVFLGTGVLRYSFRYKLNGEVIESFNSYGSASQAYDGAVKHIIKKTMYSTCTRLKNL